MQNSSITVEYPVHFPDALQTTPDDVEREARLVWLHN